MTGDFGGAATAAIGISPMNDKSTLIDPTTDLTQVGGATFTTFKAHLPWNLED